MSEQRINPDRDFYNLLEGLSREAKTERLECAVTLLKSLISALRHHDVASVPPGFLTVDGWFDLLNHWETVLNSFPKRQVNYSMLFFKEVLNRPEFKVPPMSPLLTELATLMENYSEHLDSKAAA
ncbi:MAG: hypothetical protein HQL84_01330 [Magnetococcales bacterium]|nr:hypothetical protein [Magnetococcales bacterium]MBF0148670.1 hypothetical protein [Magnetococcales bacterium]MBF0174101.1 hypothetical protein [Magnetococcales bacterium]MBF0349179.1 hypothetical protein [Magnetococcales bacterium]MBF0631476.1 hypothetical protein [Magnetococcales bacterium]